MSSLLLCLLLNLANTDFANSPKTRHVIVMVINRFVSPHTCDAHLNRHLGYEYGPCGTCGYTNASKDSYDKHKCFAGIKTGRWRPASRGEKARKRIAGKKEKEQKEERVGKKNGRNCPSRNGTWHRRWKQCFLSKKVQESRVDDNKLLRCA